MFSGSIDKGFSSRMANGIDNELVSRALWHDKIFHQLISLAGFGHTRLFVTSKLDNSSVDIRGRFIH